MDCNKRKGDMENISNAVIQIFFQLSNSFLVQIAYLNITWTCGSSVKERNKNYLLQTISPPLYYSSAKTLLLVDIKHISTIIFFVEHKLKQRNWEQLCHYEHN